MYFYLDTRNDGDVMRGIVGVTGVVRAEQLVQLPVDVLRAVVDFDVFQKTVTEHAHPKTHSNFEVKTI